jgi:predicted oxidoreductase
MIDERGRVLEADGRVIPGLVAAGEGAGQAFFDDYIGGSALTNCLVNGRIAGREPRPEEFLSEGRSPEQPAPPPEY